MNCEINSGEVCLRPTNGASCRRSKRIERPTWLAPPVGSSYLACAVAKEVLRSSHLQFFEDEIRCTLALEPWPPPADVTMDAHPAKNPNWMTYWLLAQDKTLKGPAILFGSYYATTWGKVVLYLVELGKLSPINFLRLSLTRILWF